MIEKIALNRLIPSLRNVRKCGDAQADLELKADIQSRGLLQNLIVTKARKPKGCFAVEAGERRRRALQALADEGLLAEDHEVGCLVIHLEGCEEASLAENFQRLAMNPADECLAFRRLVSEFWSKTEDKLLQELASGKKLRTPVSIIYHSLDDVNEKLRLGRYFFMDIVRDGVPLFEEPGHPFVQPNPLSPAEALRETQDYFDEWFESAQGFQRNAGYAGRDGDNKLAAFLLHQAAERFYHCLFLVRTLYSPKTHNLNQLRQLAEAMEPSLKEVWPRSSKFERRCYELLRDAYVKARYSRQYRISGEQLSWLAERVEMLRDTVRGLCEARIAELSEAA